MLRILITIGFVVFSQGSFAGDIYRCEKPTGGIRFQDHPCPASGSSQRIRKDPNSSSMQNTRRPSERYKQVAPNKIWDPKTKRYYRIPSSPSSIQSKKQYTPSIVTPERITKRISPYSSGSSDYECQQIMTEIRVIEGELRRGCRVKRCESLKEKQRKYKKAYRRCK